ncbi:hypothetical protein GCM10011578_060790 [Streptomyces fuscichromogenes]|uniref:GE37468 family thiazolyl peptide n=2 Tax=Streptomyces TaxID=1883 RepID=A0A917XHK6_9ACTN|nr:hypothetical protein GCM10011578_060790 [Streptomyces fuscichromogenes]
MAISPVREIAAGKGVKDMEEFDELVLDDSAFELVDLGKVVPASVTAGYGLTELSASGGQSSCCCCCPCCSCT